MKPGPGPGLELVDVPRPSRGRRRGADQGAAHRDLRHRRAHPRRGTRGRSGRCGRRWSSATRSPATWRGRAGGRHGGRRRRRERGRAHRLRPVPQLPGRPSSAVPEHRRRGGRTATAGSPSTSSSRPPTCGGTGRTSTSTSPRSSTRSATRCTPRCRSRCWGRTSWSPAPDRSAIMAAAVVRHAGARHVVITDVSDVPAGPRPTDGRHPRRRPTHRPSWPTSCASST